MPKRSNNRMILGIFAVLAFVFGGVAAGIYYGIIPNPLDSLSNITTKRISVNCVFYSYDRYSAGTAANIAWDIYDANMNLLETQTASSGKVTLGTMLTTGDYIYIQARANDPSDGVDPYLGPLTKVYIDPNKASEAGDTISLGTFYVEDVSTAPTLSIVDQGGNSIADKTGNYFNTSDTGFTITLSGCASGDVFGLPEPVTDQRTGKSYDGMWLIWKGSANQNFDADYVLTDASNVYYIWDIGQLVNDPDVTNDGQMTFAVSVTTGSLAADSTVVIDIVDFCQIGSDGGPYSIASLFAADVDVTAITTKVA